MAKTHSAVPSQRTPDSRGSGEKPGWRSALRRWAVLLPPLVGIALCVPLWLATREWQTTVGGPGPTFYPRLLIGLFVLAMVIRFVQDMRVVRRGVVETDEDEEAIPEEGAELDVSLISGRHVAIIIAISAGYVVGTIYLGWILATFLMVVVFLVLAGKRNLLLVVPIALGLALGFAYVFVKVVYLSLPTGVGLFDDISVLIFELMGAY